MNSTATPSLERSVVGAVLIANHAFDAIDIEPKHFHDPKASTAWRAIQSLRQRDVPVDLVTLEAEIAKHLDRVGEKPEWVLPYLGDCAANVPTEENAAAYASEIRAEWLHREVVAALADFLEQGKTRRLVGQELLDASLAASNALDRCEGRDKTASLPELVRARLRELESEADAKMRGLPLSSALPTGVVGLDAKIGGWPIGIASVIAARPGMGKSSLGLATALANAKAGNGVHVFSLEDSQRAYSDRTIAQHSGVPVENLRSLELERGQMDSLFSSLTTIRQMPNWLFDERSGISATEVVRTVRRYARKNNTRIVVVDYLQLLTRERGESSHDAITRSITTLADAAKQDEMAYVVMSQLNRGLEQRDDKRPRLSDLRESGSIEERSKLVVGLYRGASYGDPVDGVDYEARREPRPSDDEFRKRMDLLVLKNSNGRTGLVRANWHGPTTRIW